MRSVLAALLLLTSSFGAAAPDSCREGIERFASGDYWTAQSRLWDCVNSREGDSTDAYYLSLTYRSLRNYEDGLAKAEKALTIHRDQVDFLYLAAYLHYRRNETKESMLLASKAYGVSPNDWRVHQMFALNYISFHMLDAAKLSLLRAISLNAANAELYYQLARLYFTLGSYAKSIEASKQALKILPEYPEVFHNLALAYEGSGNEELAFGSFETAIELNRKSGRRDEWPLIDFATYQRMGGKPEMSYSLLQEALSINPQSPKANYEMGELLRDLKRYEEARTYLKKAVDLEPCNPRAIYGLALVTRTLGDRDAAAKLLTKFREIDRASTNAAAASCP